MTTLKCPYCGADVQVETVVDHNYGADADGNRGVTMAFTEVVSQDCDCDLDDWDFEDEYIDEEDPRDEYNPDDRYDYE